MMKCVACRCQEISALSTKRPPRQDAALSNRPDDVRRTLPVDVDCPGDRPAAIKAPYLGWLGGLRDVLFQSKRIFLTTRRSRAWTRRLAAIPDLPASV